MPAKPPTSAPTKLKPLRPRFFEHGRGHAQMVPGAGVVAGPGGSVALAAGVGGAREDEGTLVGRELAEAIEGGARVFHAVDIVDLGVCGGARSEVVAGDAVHDVERHGLVGRVEDRGLVHVVPETCDAVMNELAV